MGSLSNRWMSSLSHAATSGGGTTTSAVSLKPTTSRTSRTCFPGLTFRKMYSMVGRIGRTASERLPSSVAPTSILANTCSDTVTVEPSTRMPSRVHSFITDRVGVGVRVGVGAGLAHAEDTAMVRTESARASSHIPIAQIPL